VPTLGPGFGQVDDQLEVGPRLGSRIVDGSLCLRDLGDVNGRQEHAAQGLLVGKLNNGVRVGHIHPDTAQDYVDARDTHLDRLAGGRGRRAHVDAVARPLPLVLGFGGHALDAAARGDVQSLPDRQVHEPLATQVIDENTHTVAAHLRL